MPVDETRVEFADLAAADLLVDAVYAGGDTATFAADPLQHLLPVGNQGGFRQKVERSAGAAKRVLLVALFTSGREPDWPDVLDEQTGLFTYFGDNRKPGRELHDTSRGGNQILRKAFDGAHGDVDRRRTVPPFLLFASTGTGRDIRFRGLLAPGAATLSSDDDLQAIWRSTRGLRFQNYRAWFTVLDEPVIPRTWLNEVLAGDPLGP